MWPCHSLLLWISKTFLFSSTQSTLTPLWENVLNSSHGPCWQRHRQGTCPEGSLKSRGASCTRVGARKAWWPMVESWTHSNRNRKHGGCYVCSQRCLNTHSAAVGSGIGIASRQQRRAEQRCHPKSPKRAVQSGWRNVISNQGDLALDLSVKAWDHTYVLAGCQIRHLPRCFIF